MTADTPEDTGIDTTDRTLTIRRTFDAPRERVWRAWTDEAELAAWWGPADWTLPENDLTFEEGGVWHFCMEGPDGEPSWGKMVFEEITEPERIVATDVFADEDGNQVPDTPELRLTVEFEDCGGETALTLRHEGFPPGEMSEEAGTGWSGSFDDLDAHLEAA